MKQMILLAAVGATGTLARYGVNGLMLRLAGSAFPWGTFTVNAVGCFLFGVVWMLAERRVTISPEQKVILLTGFMGAFTTFSSFAFETARQMQTGQWGAAAGNLLLNNVIGIALVFAGFWVGGRV